jgi:hypothetical protein
MENTKPNHVIVTVEADDTPVCNPHDLPVAGSDAVLKFSLQTAGYVFLKDGAVVVNDPGDEFPFPSRTLPPNDTMVTLYDRNTATGAFGYTVFVQKIATGEILRVDPTINNEG